MIRKQSPKKLWDHCLELESLICSHTAYDNFPLNGEVPKTLIKGAGADISNICEYEWYEWVKYLDTSRTYPDNKWLLGIYLGPAPDVGSMMTSKILRHTGDHVPRSTLRPLKDWEITDPDQIEQRLKFDRLVHDALGKPAVEIDFSW